MASQKDLFAKTSTKRMMGKLYAGFRKKEGPKTLTIIKKPCKVNPEHETTNITRYFCAQCHFEGWWW